MNYEMLERTVVAHLFIDTKQYPRVPEEYLFDDRYISLYRVGKKLMDTVKNNKITYIEVKSYINLEWGKYKLSPTFFDDFFDYIVNDLEMKPARVRREEFQGALSKLSERIRINDVRMALKHAEMLAEEGKVNEAIIEVRGLSLKQVGELPNTKDIIIQSLDKTEGIVSGIKFEDPALTVKGYTRIMNQGMNISA